MRYNLCYKMKKLIIYLYYGFYQIDHVLGIHEPHTYNTRTGGALLHITLFLYVYSFLCSTVLVLSWLQNLSKAVSTILIGISSILGILAVLGLSFYIQDERFYKDEFKKLDASPDYIKLTLFGGSLLSLIIGGYILYMTFNITM